MMETYLLMLKLEETVSMSESIQSQLISSSNNPISMEVINANLLLLKNKTKMTKPVVGLSSSINSCWLVNNSKFIRLFIITLFLENKWMNCCTQWDAHRERKKVCFPRGRPEICLWQTQRTPGAPGIICAIRSNSNGTPSKHCCCFLFLMMNDMWSSFLKGALESVVYCCVEV